jgi:AcrR family transcriptional regulator
MKGRRRVKRSYRSQIRDARAEETRAAIIAAATTLFAERGYVATSISDIAARAGVSRATVFNAVGAKPELLIRAYQTAVRGREPDVPLGEQARSRRILAETDPHRLLAGYATVVTETGPRIAPLYEAVRAAAHADAEAALLWQRLTGERRYGAGRVVRAVAKLGPLRAGLNTRTATDVLWLLNDPALYRQLVIERGWSARRFRNWLTGTMQAQLLPPTPRAGERALRAPRPDPSA